MPFELFCSVSQLHARTSESFAAVGNYSGCDYICDDEGNVQAGTRVSLVDFCLRTEELRLKDVCFCEPKRSLHLRAELGVSSSAVVVIQTEGTETSSSSKCSIGSLDYEVTFSFCLLSYRISPPQSFLLFLCSIVSPSLSSPPFFHLPSPSFFLPPPLNLSSPSPRSC